MADLPSTPMLKLPNELLDHVFSYLDWDRSKDLYPTKPDIINGSLRQSDLSQTARGTEATRFPRCYLAIAMGQRPAN